MHTLRFADVLEKEKQFFLNIPKEVAALHLSDKINPAVLKAVPELFFSSNSTYKALNERYFCYLPVLEGESYQAAFERNTTVFIENFERNFDCVEWEYLNPWIFFEALMGRIEVKEDGDAREENAKRKFLWSIQCSYGFCELPQDISVKKLMSVVKMALNVCSWRKDYVQQERLIEAYVERTLNDKPWISQVFRMDGVAFIKAQSLPVWKVKKHRNIFLYARYGALSLMKKDFFLYPSKEAYFSSGYNDAVLAVISIAIDNAHDGVVEYMIEQNHGKPVQENIEMEKFCAEWMEGTISRGTVHMLRFLWEKFREHYTLEQLREFCQNSIEYWHGGIKILKTLLECAGSDFTIQDFQQIVESSRHVDEAEIFEVIFNAIERFSLADHISLGKYLFESMTAYVGDRAKILMSTRFSGEQLMHFCKEAMRKNCSETLEYAFEFFLRDSSFLDRKAIWSWAAHHAFLFQEKDRFSALTLTTLIMIQKTLSVGGNACSYYRYNIHKYAFEWAMCTQNSKMAIWALPKIEEKVFPDTKIWLFKLLREEAAPGVRIELLKHLKVEMLSKEEVGLLLALQSDAPREMLERLYQRFGIPYFSDGYAVEKSVSSEIREWFFNLLICEMPSTVRMQVLGHLRADMFRKEDMRQLLLELQLCTPGDALEGLYRKFGIAPAPDAEDQEPPSKRPRLR